ncbi:MAG: ferrous iron transport protein A [Phycisphaerae bacterium]|nr:ferrous iron transport protein A [Phycisphaerae bacterium]
MSLASVPNRRCVRITGVRHGGMSCRLMEMGLITGAEVRVLRRAPLGDPLQIRVGDCELAVRASDADLIDVVDL